MLKHYFLSFIEDLPDVLTERLINTRYIKGRVEVYDEFEKYPYAVEEIRFYTDKVAEFNDFKDQYDYVNVDLEELNEIKETLKDTFYEKAQ